MPSERHEAVGVSLLFDGQAYPLGDGADAVLADELRGYAEGRFPDMVTGVIRTEVAGLHWTDGAPELAALIEDVRADPSKGPVPVEGKAIETLRAALGPIVDGDPQATGAAELLAALKTLDCKVCWGLGWTPVFVVAESAPVGDEWSRCRRCLGTGTRSQTGAERAKPNEPPRRHRAHSR